MSKQNIINALKDWHAPACYKAYILATIHHETGGRFETIVENLNYTTTKRLRAVWPSRFPTDAAARPYVNNPRDLANLVYGGRMGNDYLNDGYTYRGRGYVQITGRDNYQKFKDLMGTDFINYPQYMFDEKISLEVAIVGMSRGMFTGKKLSDYLVNGKFDYLNARRIINNDVKRVGKEIADKAIEYTELF